MNRKRNISDAEFLASFKSVVRRLDTHLQSLDRGDYHVRDDVATLLRVLLASGQGDDAIAGLTRRFKLPVPTRRLSAPALEANDVALALGGLPTADAGIEVTVPEGLRTTLVFLSRQGPTETRATWANIVADYGNTSGAHLSTTVPRMLDNVHFFGLSETDFATYVLRALGVLTSSVCHELLQQVDPAHVPVDYERDFCGTQIFQLIYRFNGSDAITFASSRANWRAPGTVCTLQSNTGNLLNVSFTEDGKQQLSIETPVGSSKRPPGLPPMTVEEAAKIEALATAGASVRLEIVCTRCKTVNNFQLDFLPDQPLEGGSVRYPNSGVAWCRNCSSALPVATVRNAAEKALGRTGLARQPT